MNTLELQFIKQWDLLFNYSELWDDIMPYSGFTFHINSIAFIMLSRSEALLQAHFVLPHGLTDVAVFLAVVSDEDAIRVAGIKKCKWKEWSWQFLSFPINKYN